MLCWDPWLSEAFWDVLCDIGLYKQTWLDLTCGVGSRSLSLSLCHLLSDIKLRHDASQNCSFSHWRAQQITSCVWPHGNNVKWSAWHCSYFNFAFMFLKQSFQQSEKKKWEVTCGLENLEGSKWNSLHKKRKTTKSVSLSPDACFTLFTHKIFINCSKQTIDGLKSCLLQCVCLHLNQLV